MTQAFGGAVRLFDQSLPRSGDDMELVRRALAELGPGGTGLLRIYRPQPTAAFSPRDTTHPLYQSVANMMRERGFEPGERGAGGRLAIYDQTALVIDLVASHPQSREHIHERFRLFAEAIASALSAIGVDARVGPVEGEYCPGDFSVNAKGRIKLAGLAQRVNRHGYRIGAVLSIERSDAARAAVTEAYHVFGIPFEPSTFGSLTDLLPSLSFDAVRAIIGTAISARLDIVPSP